MRALTIRQPWASLIAIGAKTIETRSWPTKYRGELLIHAGKAPIDGVLNLGPWEAWPADAPGQPHPNHPDGRPARLYSNAGGSDWLAAGRWSVLPLGAVVAVATLADCVPIVSRQACRKVDPGPQQLHRGASGLRLYDCTGNDYVERSDQLPLGDFTPGRWAWMLTDVRHVEPVPAKGRQGLWTPDADLVAAVTS